jgi:signal transduction histidine kinase/CheY-like chemotaxis protein
LNLSAKPVRILLVEDAEPDAMLLERELHRQGFAPVMWRVETHETMLAALHAEPWDVVLSDHSMPQFSSQQAIQTIRGAGLDLPLIVVSGSIGEQRAVEVMRSGAADWVSKDNLARLGAAIQRELDEAENRRHRREAEAQVFDLNRDLRRRISEFETLLRVIPIGIGVAEDAECHVIRGNPGFERILGCEPGVNVSLSAPSSKRQPYRINYPSGEEVPVDLLPMQLAARGAGVVSQQELEVVRADGTRCIIYGSAAPLFDERGDARGAVGAFTDVTAMKAAENTLRSTEKLATVGRLAATIAHEINNPLEAVGNILYMLANSGLSPQPAQMVSLAQQELQRVGGIVRNTLGFYREAGSPVRLKLAELLDSVLSLYERKLKSSGITVVRDFRGAGETSGFPGELRQVFTNLVVNAADALAGRRGCIKIPLAPRVAADGRRGTRVTIADNGPGIPKQHRPQLFQAFFTTKGEKGTGLGLWVTQGIVAKHEGRIRARSSDHPGRQGTVFSLFFPDELSAAAHPRVSRAS